MYDLIYQYLMDYIYTSTDLVGTSKEILGLTMNLNEWLSHTTTIAIMVLFVLIAIWFVRWMFRLVGGLFILK